MKSTKIILHLRTYSNILEAYSNLGVCDKVVNRSRKDSKRAFSQIIQLVEAAQLVSTCWGIVLFGEYRTSSRTYILLGTILLMFIVVVAVLMASFRHLLRANWSS